MASSRRKLRKAVLPNQPPKADMNALLAKVDEIAGKVGVPKLGTGARALAGWKRWVGGEAEYDVTGLRDVVNANAIQQNQIKAGLDVHSQAILELRADVQALKEAPAPRPFP